MVQMKSLRAEIMERLDLHKGGESTARHNIAKASKDFSKSNAPQFRGKPAAKRHQMAVAAGLAAARGESAVPKVGDNMIYEGKAVVVKSINESGMAVVRFGNHREVIIRVANLKAVEKEQLTETFIGLAPIGPTWREPTDYGFVKLEGLDPEDIGLISIYEDDEEEEKDEQEEDHDNGSNVRQDGHTGRKEIDELPTPSDTIVPAYSDKKPPKEISEPLSTHVGAEEDKLWQQPQWDGYDYPADAPEIPTAEFDGSDMGNSRAPHFNAGEHQPGDGQAPEEDESDESDEVKEGQVSDPARDEGEGHKSLAKRREDIEFSEAYFVAEMDDMLGGEDKEPSKNETITVTMPAMASILVTVAHRMGADMQEGGQDEMLLKAIVEALAEIGHGSKSGCIDMPDLDAVAAHINGEELPEIENREEGKPDHEGIEGHEGGDEGHQAHDSEWPGDGEPSKGGKTKLMADYYGGDDVMEATRMTDDEEIELLRSRAFPNRIRW